MNRSVEDLDRSLSPEEEEIVKRFEDAIADGRLPASEGLVDPGSRKFPRPLSRTEAVEAARCKCSWCSADRAGMTYRKIAVAVGKPVSVVAEVIQVHRKLSEKGAEDLFMRSWRGY